MCTGSLCGFYFSLCRCCCCKTTEYKLLLSLCMCQVGDEIYMARKICKIICALGVRVYGTSCRLYVSLRSCFGVCHNLGDISACAWRICFARAYEMTTKNWNICELRGATKEIPSTGFVLLRPWDMMPEPVHFSTNAESMSRAHESYLWGGDYRFAG